MQLLVCRQLHITGPLRQSPRALDRLLARCNDVGLLAEEFGLLTGRMLGNFPQAHSHVGLINLAQSESTSRPGGGPNRKAELP